MAPKRRTKVVGSVVKTKVVQATVEVATAAVADDSTEPPAPLTVDVSGSTVVQVEARAGEAERPKKRQEVVVDGLQEKQPETPSKAAERKRKPKQGIKGRRRRWGRGRVSSAGDAGMGGVGGYKRYVWRVLKQVHPDMGASGHTMEVLDMMMADMFERLADEAARLCKSAGRATLTSREVQSAVRLVLPGELGKHAVSEGTKAIARFMSA